MKKIFVMLMMMVALAPASMAQEKTADDYKNDGNAAVREKNYQAALEAYKQAITMWGDEADAKTVYNAADCAKRIGDNNVAIEYYNKSIALDYKVDYAKYYIAEIYGKDGKIEERIALLEESLPKCTDEKVSSFMKKGLAKEYTNKAMAFYKEGSTILADCQTAKPDQYDAIKARAAEKFKEAKPWVDKTISVDPENANAKQILNGIKEYVK